MIRRALGVCCYPEHRPEDWWREDARRMADIAGDASLPATLGPADLHRAVKA